VAQGIPEHQGLAALLTQGTLGPLNFALTLDEVRELLGEPAWVGAQSYGGEDNMIELHYHTLELMFLDGAMYYFGIYPEKGDELPAALHAEWYQTVRQMSYDQFVDYARRHEIRCQRIVGPWVDPDKELWFDGAAVHIVFDADNQYRFAKLFSSPHKPRLTLEDCW